VWDARGVRLASAADACSRCSRCSKQRPPPLARPPPGLVLAWLAVGCAWHVVAGRVLGGAMHDPLGVRCMIPKGQGGEGPFGAGEHFWGLGPGCQWPPTAPRPVVWVRSSDWRDDTATFAGAHRLAALPASSAAARHAGLHVPFPSLKAGLVFQQPGVACRPVISVGTGWPCKGTGDGVEACWSRDRRHGGPQWRKAGASASNVSCQGGGVLRAPLSRVVVIGPQLQPTAGQLAERPLFAVKIHECTSG
jgi:hypothetical protein